MGCQIAVETGNQSLSATISKPHDPPKVGNQDRVEQSDNYQRKDWAELKLGTLVLKKGTCDLKLTGIKKPGNELIDVKGIELMRLQSE